MLLKSAALRVLLLAFAIDRVLPAQSDSGSSALQGTVADPGGSRVSGAHVKATNEENGYRRAGVTDANGRFFLPVLPVGSYRVEVAHEGMVVWRLDKLTLAVGEASTLDVRMSIASLAESVTVEAAAAAIDPEQAATASTIGQRAVEDLPVRGRNFVEFAQLTPGVMQESDRSGLVIAGQRSINSNVNIDGGDFNDPLQGNQRGGNQATFFFPQSAVREFQVVRSGASAEIGRTTAGFVNVVTKSGTNDFHGDAFYFGRAKALTSPDAFGRQLDNRQNQFGGSLGGALKKDRAFFFAAAEQNFLRVPFYVKFLPQPAGTTVPAGLAQFEGEQHGSNNPTAVYVRQDTILTPRHTLNVTYNYTRMRGDNFNFESAQPEVAATANFQYRSESQAGKVALVSVLTPRLINEVRGQIATDYRTEQPNVDLAQIVITGFGTLGGDTGRPRVFDARRHQASDNLSYSAGSHFLRFGTDVNINYFAQQRASNVLGRYDFRNLADYAAVRINRYRQTLVGFKPEDLMFNGYGKELAFFMTDKWNVTRHLTVNAGLRWDGQWNPQPERPNPAIPQTSVIPNDLGMWQPRLGLAWSPGESGHTVIRLAGGLLSARTPANLFQRVSTENGLATVAVDSRTDPGVLNSLKFPNGLASLPPNLKTPAPRVFGFTSDFLNPQSAQFSATLEQTVAHNFVVTAGYIRNSTWNLQRRLDRNLLPPTINAAGVPVYPASRPNPAVGQLSVNESSAHSSYDGLLLTATRRFSRRIRWQANYTYAANWDDDSNERNFSREPTYNVFDLTRERAYSKQDIRHSFNTNTQVDLPRGISFSAILLARSGVPYLRVVGFDTQNDGNDDNDRAVINGRAAARNDGRQPKFLDLDLRLQKRFRLGERSAITLSAEGFNVTKHANRNFGVDGVSLFGTPQQPTAGSDRPYAAPSTARYGGPRQLQVGARFVF